MQLPLQCGVCWSTSAMLLSQKIDDLFYYKWAAAHSSDSINKLVATDGSTLLSHIVYELNHSLATTLCLLLAIGIDVKCDGISFHD